MMKFNKILIVLPFFISLFVVNFAYAGIHTGPLVPCTGSSCNICHLWQLGSNIINFISFNLAIPVATLLFIVAGVFFLTSGGDESRVTKARTIFTNTVIGLIIIFASWLLIDTLFKTLANGTTAIGFQIKYSWNVFPTCSAPVPPPPLP